MPLQEAIRNSKTSTAGAGLAGLAALLTLIPEQYRHYVVIVALVVTAIGLFFGRDADKSTEESKGVRSDTDLSKGNDLRQ